MNALTTTGGGAGFALVPTNMREAMDLATMMSKGKLVPQALQDKPADCLLVIEQACRWGMSPFAVAQEVSVISGKLMHSGKIVAAAVQSSGALSGRLNYAYEGEGDNRTVTVTGTRRGEREPLAVKVRLGEAKTTNQQWTKQPDQQLAYHASRVWARRYVPEVMLGVYAPEEFDEAPSAAPMPPARGPVVDAKPEAPAEVRAPWEGMAWPICDRLGNCKDYGDADSWAAELQSRIATIQGRALLDDAAKEKAIRQVRDANRAAFGDLRSRGYPGQVGDIEALFRKALGEAEEGE